MEIIVFEQEARDQVSYHEKQNYSLYWPRFEQMIKWTKIAKPRIVLDIFSSWGYFLTYIQEQFLNISPVGLDISTTKVDYCRKKGQTIIQGDIRFLEPERIYDIVYFSDNLGYFENPIEIGEIVSKWGKYLILTTPLYNKEEDFQELYEHGLWKSYPKKEEHFEIASLVGKMIEFTTVKGLDVNWDCSLIEVKN